MVLLLLINGTYRFGQGVRLSSGSLGCHLVGVCNNVSNGRLSALRIMFRHSESGAIVEGVHGRIRSFRCHAQMETRGLRGTELLRRRTRRLGPWGGKLGVDMASGGGVFIVLLLVFCNLLVYLGCVAFAVYWVGGGMKPMM